MLMKSENDEVINQVRETVQRVCEEFDGEYWREKDREREYPTEFVNKLTELESSRKFDSGRVRRKRFINLCRI